MLELEKVLFAFRWRPYLGAMLASEGDEEYQGKSTRDKSLKVTRVEVSRYLSKDLLSQKDVREAFIKDKGNACQGEW